MSRDTSTTGHAASAFRAVTAAVLWGCLATPAGAQVILYGAATDCVECQPEPSTLYTVDPETAVATEVGPIVDGEGSPFFNVTGMAFLRDGRLVASANGDVDEVHRAILIEIDRTSGVASLIGEIDNDDTGICGRMPDLAYDAYNRLLYGIADRCFGGSSNDQLYQVDPDTGAGTRVRVPPMGQPMAGTGTNLGGNGLAWWPYDRIWYFAPGDDNALYTINRSTGIATVIAGSQGNVGDGLDANGLAAMSVHPLSGVLYGALKDGETGDSYLVTVDRSDGTTTVVGEIIESGGNPLENFDALAFYAPAGCPLIPFDEVAPSEEEAPVCHQAKSGGSKLGFKAAKAKEDWSWKGAETTKAEFGDPTSDTDQRVCIFEAQGDTHQTLVAGQLVPAGEGWKDKKKGFKYKSKDGAPDGITKVLLKEGGDGKARVKVQGKGVQLPTLPIDNSQCIIDCVVVELINSDGGCWHSEFTNYTKNNNEGRYKAKN
jgi:hypothetical protein